MAGDKGPITGGRCKTEAPGILPGRSTNVKIFTVVNQDGILAEGNALTGVEVAIIGTMESDGNY